MSASLERALALRAEGRPEESLSLLAELHAASPDDPLLVYEYACGHDALGDERGAIPLYERALELGLGEPERRGALLGLGSSYRCLGRYAEAERTLRRGLADYADGSEFVAFLALTLHNLGQHSEATGLLLRLLADTSAAEPIRAYSRALRYYAERPDEVW